MDKTELIRPQDVLDKVIVAKAHLNNFTRAIGRLSEMTGELKWEMNVPQYDYALIAIQTHSLHIAAMLGHLTLMKAAAEKDIEEGIEFYLPHETREFTQEKLVDITQKDMPY